MSGDTLDGVRGAFPIEVPLCSATDGNPQAFVPLAKGSTVIPAPSGGGVFDSRGRDIFVTEADDIAERAPVRVSPVWDGSFTLRCH